jgi:aspartyl-tRNA(Asn)/glutamyl-tRNA(Gln) amidotransferase subunit B
MPYEVVIGLEVHAELATQSKMFCTCAVVDATRSEPNVAVCPVCAGMPGMLPVVNRQAVEYGMRVALALECQVATTSLFDRKNYFYPDLPKGYQISQYEHPLAAGGRLVIQTARGERVIRIRRVHLEEDTGKLTHASREGQSFSLVDLNRAGVPLLEIVSEPDMHSVEEARAYTTQLRAILRELGVNSGDMEKGVIRFEANISLRPVGAVELGTRTEIKNLNSFKIMEKAILYEIARQTAVLDRGERVIQETVGWNEATGETFSQRSKEDAHDYRYFPEPDLPPLVIEPEWIERVRAALPELPRARALRLQSQQALTPYQADVLVMDSAMASYFEQCVQAAPDISPATFANWILGEISGWVNQSGKSFSEVRVTPARLAELLRSLAGSVINQTTAKSVLAEMLESGQTAAAIIQAGGRQQISDSGFIADLVGQVLEANPQEVKSYLAGKETVANWFFGQVMRQAKGQANPQVVRAELERQLKGLKGGA